MWWRYLFFDVNGKKLNDFTFDGMFFYGTISKKDDHYLAIGTKFSEEYNDSCLYLISFDNEGNILFETNFGRSYVIISDTSGFWMYGEYLYLNYNKSIYKVNSDNGEIEWATNVNGISARRLPVVCGNLLFYTKLSVEIGCLNKKNGTLVWTVSTQERSIVAPPTIYNGTLLVLADCSLYLIDKMNGSFYSKKAIGHSPYSAIKIFNNSVFVGCGEPPVNGLLTSYEITEDNIS